MTIRLELTCERCGRQELATREAQDRWSQLKTPGRALDICPACTADIKGWKAPLRRIG